MTLRTAPRRAGLTLVEALVAMFVAALALISLLALFPFGALQMAQSLKDARCAEMCINADAVTRTYWSVEAVEKKTDANLMTQLATGNPVFVDPIGTVSNTTNPTAVAGITQLPRTTFAAFPASLRFRLCSLLDDMTFDPSGQPVVSGTFVERAGRYNWLAVLQQPGGSRAANTADLTVLVFDGRSASFSPGNAEQAFALPSPGTIVAPAADPLVGTTTVTFSTGTTNPPLAKGRWIGLFTFGGTRNAQYLAFYRVVSVNDATPGQLTLELQTPVKPGHTRAVAQAADTQPTTTVLTFAGLAEVFERPAATP